MPSNSRKTLRPALPAGSLKCLRYHAIPVERSLMSFLKASSSFQACGNVTSFHEASLKSARSAPGTSPTNSFQPELKLYLARAAEFGGGAATAPMASEMMKTNVVRRCTVVLSPQLPNGLTAVTAGLGGTWKASSESG